MNVRAFLATVVVISAAISACDTAEATTPPAPPPAPVAATTAPPVQTPVGAVLAEVEVMRVALAADTTAPIAASLVALQQANAALKASGHPAADAVAAGATAIEGALPKAGAEVDIKAIRTAYGELSKAAVAIITADPALQQGRTLFECPMAPGYKRWVQPSPQMANPYMGTRMLECGSVIVAWKVEG